MYKCNCWSYLQHTLNNPIDTSSALGCHQLTCKFHSQGSMKESGMHVYCKNAFSSPVKCKIDLFINSIDFIDL